MTTQVAATPEEATPLLAECGALLRGHFVLSSGLHSPQYFQCATITERSDVAERVATAIASKCRELQPEVVLSPALGAILIGYELSRALGIRNVFAERPAGKFELRRGFSLRPGERVLLAENVITTGGSVLEVAELVRAAGAQIVGYAMIVDRSGGRFAPPEPVIAYTALQAITHEPDGCPLCAQGLPITKPGSRK